MAKQTNLFSKSTSDQSKENGQKATAYTAEDKAYHQLVKDGLANRCHIYPSERCRQIIQWHLLHGNIILDNDRTLSRVLNTVKDNSYYHMASLFKVYRYNAWLMYQVDKSLKGQHSDVERH